MSVASIVATVFCVPAGAHAAAAATPRIGAVPGQALVRFVPGTAPSSAQAVLRRVGATTERRIGAIGFELVRLPTSAAFAALRDDPRVAVAEPNYTGRIATTDDCLDQPCWGTPGQWHWAMNNRAFASRAFTPAPGAHVTIAVLDTHIDATHPDLRDQLDLVSARDWVPPSRWTGSAAYHGTFVAGLAAAADNDLDMAGMAPAARIVPLTVVDGGGTTDAASVAEAILYARDKGARIINLSLGINGDSRAVHDAIKAVSGEVLVVAAAGNNTGSAAFYPGSYPEVMSVSGTDAGDRRAPCSNYNANVSVSAPADRLIGDAPMPNERTQAPCGTSAAAPQVSALGALLLLQDPSRTPSVVRGIIEGSADDLGAPGSDNYFGYGRINAERALNRSAPQVSQARASVAKADGASAIVARCSATAADAEIVVDRPGAPPTSLTVSGTSIDGTVIAPTTPGAHPAWIRCFDGTAWSPATVTVIAVDGRAPTTSNTQVSAGAPAAGQPVVVTLTASDDLSPTVSIGIEYRATATGQIVHKEARYHLATGALRVEWLPPLTVTRGHYTVKIAVADESGNVSQQELGTIIA